MKIGGMGWLELLIILVIILLIFGPKLIPKLGRSFKNTRKNFSKEVKASDAQNDENGADEQAASAAEPAKLEAAKGSASSKAAAADKGAADKGAADKGAASAAASGAASAGAADAGAGANASAANAAASSADAAAESTWTCKCGAEATGKFCGECGRSIVESLPATGDPTPAVSFGSN